MGKERNSCENKKIVFMGTPNIATYALKALLDMGFDVDAIITQPDKPVGRKKDIVFSDVKKFALNKNIKIFQPTKIIEIINDLKEIEPFAFVTCAYGQFIPESILQIPKFGCINIHASLLPKYRGGAPIQWSIINGETETGVCLMKTIKQMDAGPVYSYRKINIDENETSTSLFNKMNNLVYEIVFQDIIKVFDGEILEKNQDESLVSFAYNITKENEKISFNQEAKKIKNWVNGLSDYPGAYSIINEKKIKFFLPTILETQSNTKAGTIIDINKNGLFVSTKDFNICFKEIQIEGKKRQKVSEILNGNKLLLKNSFFE